MTTVPPADLEPGSIEPTAVGYLTAAELEAIRTMGALGLTWVALAACWWGYLAERRSLDKALAGWRKALAGWRKSLDRGDECIDGWRRSDATILALATAIAQAIADLDGSHYVNEHGDMCAVCGAADGSWPCAAREVADDLRRAVES